MKTIVLDKEKDKEKIRQMVLNECVTLARSISTIIQANGGDAVTFLRMFADDLEKNLKKAKDLENKEIEGGPQ